MKIILPKIYDMVQYFNLKPQIISSIDNKYITFSDGDWRATSLTYNRLMQSVFRIIDIA